ncbi:MAG: GNAT family N-acetyltransferase [Chloroflexota bacterium]
MNDKSRTLQDFTSAHIPRCLEIFDANCPQYFAPNERDDYLEFLNDPIPTYQVVLLGEVIVGGVGLSPSVQNRARLSWILLDPTLQKSGIGAFIMDTVITRSKQQHIEIVDIAASHLSEPFFARFGATRQQYIEHGWGPEMHKVDMTLSIAAV